MFEFLWEGKPDKIKRNTIIQNIENGGLKMVDIELFITSLKASWVKRLSDENNKGDWKFIYTSLMEKYGGKLIFESNFESKEAKSMFNKSPFLCNIVESWAKINFDTEIENTCVINQNIWNNSFIKNKGKPLFYNQWLQLGIKSIAHLYDSRINTFYTFERLKQLYNIDNSEFLNYYTIIQSIPKRWKQIIKTQNITEPPKIPLLKLIKKSRLSPNKILYNTQIQSLNKTNEVKPHIKWEETFNNLNWKQIHSTPFKSTIDTKIRSFQYKCIMRILPTNMFLFKCKIVNSSLCDFCNRHPETFEHLFWECQYVRSFWTQVHNYCIEHNHPFNISYQLISFGFTNVSKKHLLNCIILTAKYFIFKSKMTKTIPSVTSFLLYLQKIKQIERIIAINKNKLNTHEIKWDNM